VDLIIVARGGGSIEDLWAFNDQDVARAIADSPVPTVAGVGHQVDFTIADFVADVRAPTPSAAAEVSVPDQSEVRGQLASATDALTDSIRRRIQDARAVLSVRLESLRRLSPRAVVGRDRQRLDDLFRRQERTLHAQVALQAERLGGLTRRLEGLSPSATLQRGYAIVRREDGEVVRRVAQARAGATLAVQVSDGQFAARVERSPEEA
jgi:exodeoxyribonuclease VII large subunit